VTDPVASDGFAEAADLRPAAVVGERRRPMWVMPDQVPAILPRSARFTEARWVAEYRWAALAGDLVAALIGVSLALVARFGSQISFGYVVLGATLPVAWLACVALARGYESRYFGTGPEEFRSILRAAVALTALVAVTSYATRSNVARGFVVLAVPICCIAAMVARWLLHRSIASRRVVGRCVRRVLVVGRIGQATILRRHLEARLADGYIVVATCLPRGDAGEEPDAGSEREPGGQPEPDRLGRTEMDILATVDTYAVDVVAVAADPELAGHSLRRLSWALEQRGVDLIVSPGIVEVAGPRISIRPVAGLSLLHLERPSVSGGPHLLKNIFDRVIGCTLLLLAAPVLVVVALLVRLTSSGPALFRQTRVGRAGVEFSMLKFRSMCVDAEDRKKELEALSEGNGVLFKLRDDPRVTRVGHYLRRFSLDELPQLVNVLRGEMSLVGPRPPLPAEVATYAIDDARRMLVKPGLTGLWQVSGRSDLSWDETVRLDLYYVENWSLGFDLAIIVRTIWAVARGRGAY
jgi:exopolysaccharide biosynthesis polyprenyl glycosylphosphotransferase